MGRSNCIKCTILPQRVILSIMGFLGIMVFMALRACLSIAITEMVVPVNNTRKGNDSLICSVDVTPIESNIIEKTNDKKYDWTQEEQGWVLSAYFIGYIISHIPGGLLAEKFGAKWILSIGILLISVCNAVIPHALEYGEENALIYLILLRIVMGLVSGPTYPSVTVLLAAWIPKKERGTLGTFVLGGGQIGNLVSLYLSGVMLSYWTWQVVFYVWSSIAFIWFIAFTVLCSSDPATHPFISLEEREYLEAEMGQLKRSADLPATPWIAILTCAPVIVLIITSVYVQIGIDWLFYIFASDIPKYMKDVLGFSVREIGLYSSLPYLPMWIVSILSGFVCDYLIRRKYLSVLNARKLFTFLSGIFPALLILIGSYAECDKLAAVICFIIAMGFMGNYYPGLRVNGLDLSPNYAGSIMSISNGAGALCGIIAPTFVGIMTPDSTLEQWRFVFWVTFVIALIRTSIFLLWASADIQPWNDPKEIELPEIKKLTENSENCPQNDCI